jgi:ParB-like chromosome segregation protein Spo0J
VEADPPRAEFIWPADSVMRRPIDDLVPYARNARTHSPAQIDQLAASMIEWGWTNPVLVDEHGGIIAGHGRVMAAQKLRESGRSGYETIPTMTATGWTDAQKRAYILADNKLALNAGWDGEMLALELADLAELGANLDLTGFSDIEIETLLGEAVDPEQIWEGMPEYEHEDLGSVHRIAVHFATMEDYAEFQRLIGQSLTAKTRSIWFPEAEIRSVADKRYVTEGQDADGVDAEAAADAA